MTLGIPASNPSIFQSIVNIISRSASKDDNSPTPIGDAFTALQTAAPTPLTPEARSISPLLCDSDSDGCLPNPGFVTGAESPYSDTNLLLNPSFGSSSEGTTSGSESEPESSQRKHRRMSGIAKTVNQTVSADSNSMSTPIKRKFSPSKQTLLNFDSPLKSVPEVLNTPVKGTPVKRQFDISSPISLFDSPPKRLKGQPDAPLTPIFVVERSDFIPQQPKKKLMDRPRRRPDDHRQEQASIGNKTRIAIPAAPNAISLPLQHKDKPGQLFTLINGQPVEVQEYGHGINHKIWKILDEVTVSLQTAAFTGVVAKCEPLASTIILRRPFINGKLTDTLRGLGGHQAILEADRQAYQYYRSIEGLLNSMGVFLPVVYVEALPEDAERGCSVIEFVPHEVNCEGWKDPVKTFSELSNRDQTTLNIVANLFEYSVKQGTRVIDDFYPANIKFRDNGQLVLIDMSHLKTSRQGPYEDLLCALPDLLIAWSNKNENIYSWLISRFPADVKERINNKIDDIRNYIGHFPNYVDAKIYSDMFDQKHAIQD